MAYRSLVSRASETNRSPRPNKQYFDVLLLGKTGMGKSTTGNKLLGRENALQDPPVPRFAEATEDATSHLSVTVRCQVLTNASTKVRVMDVPGFAASSALRGGGVYRSNLGIMRHIICKQSRDGLAFDRILYFLPTRGPLEKCDGALQEELKVMAYFFGSDIFRNMIIVGTRHPDESRELPRFLEKHIVKSRKIIREGLEIILDRDSRKESAVIPNPPFMYISLNDTGDELMQKLREQEVALPLGITLRFERHVCARCAVKMHIDIVDKQDATASEQPSYIIDDEKLIPIEQTKCHPVFVPKHSTTKKIAGGIAYCLTWGVANYFFELPTVYNDEELCPNCKKPPGAEGCIAIDAKYELKQGSPTRDVNIVVCHTNKVEEVHIVNA